MREGISMKKWTDKEFEKAHSDGIKMGKKIMLRNFKEVIRRMIDYRGGMGNRIDAFDIQDYLNGTKIYCEDIRDIDKRGRKK